MYSLLLRLRNKDTQIQKNRGTDPLNNDHALMCSLYCSHWLQFLSLTMGEDLRTRKCSSCKLVLPSLLFRNENTSFYYKTCLPCRYKKRLKYYCWNYMLYWFLATLSNIPLYKRDHGDSFIDADLSITTGDKDDSESSHDSFQNVSSPAIVKPVVPYAKWIICNEVQDTRVFIASAVLTPVTLDKYVGNSRKYSTVP